MDSTKDSSKFFNIDNLLENFAIQFNMILCIYYNAKEFTKASVFYANENETETMLKVCNFNKRGILRLKNISVKILTK